MDFQSLKNKRVCIVGLLGFGNILLKIIQEKGIKLTGVDDLSEKEKKPILERIPNPSVQWVFSHEDEAKILDQDLIILAAGNKKFEKMVLKAKEKKIPVLLIIDFISKFLKGPIVGITGTNGKSTTTHFLKKILDEAKMPNQVYGMLEYPFLENLDKPSVISLFEVSSSRLAQAETFHPHIAILTNISVAHQERHKSIKDYYLAKARIYANQTESDFLIYNGQNAALNEILKIRKPRSRLLPFNFAEKVPHGIYKKEQELFWQLDEEISHFFLKGFKPMGAINRENLMAAIAAAKLLKVPDSAIAAAIPKLEPLPMHLQTLATLHGVTYYNDSKAVNPAATAWALHALKKNVLLIAGGSWISARDYSQFKESLKRHVKTLILFGGNRQKFFEAWQDTVETYLVESLKEAVMLAYQKAEKGDAVLLSPTCLPELHIYRTIKNRGVAFDDFVEELKHQEKARHLLQWELNKV